MSRSTSSTVAKVLIGVLVGVLVLFFVAELGMRWFIAKQFKDDFQEQIPPGVTVEAEPHLSFGATPLAFSAITGTIPEMTMETPSTLQITEDSVVGSPMARVHMQDLTIGQDPVAGRLQLTSELPDDYLRAQLQDQIRKAVEENTGDELVRTVDQWGVSDVVANPSRSTFDISFTKNFFTVELRPVMVDGQLDFDVESTKILGFDLGDQAAQALEDMLFSGIQDQLVGPLQIQEFTVIPDGFRISLTGNDVDLTELAETTPQAPM